jgi:hypothetical protein
VPLRVESGHLDPPLRASALRPFWSLQMISGPLES